MVYLGLMTRARRIQPKAALTVVVLTLTLFCLIERQRHWDFLPQVRSAFRPAAAQTPEGGVYKMLDAARIGNVEAYLDCFSGDMQRQLSQVIKETSATQFSSYLIAQNTAFTGVAVSVIDRPDAQTARVRVEYVFSKRNEVQDISLRNIDRKWKILKVASSEQIKTLIPYGTRVTD